MPEAIDKTKVKFIFYTGSFQQNYGRFLSEQNIHHCVADDTNEW